MNVICTSGLVVIKERKLMLSYSLNKGAWYLPGGKREQGENAVQALVREIREELSLEVDPQHLRFYCHITALAFGEVNGTVMEQDCFFYRLAERVSPAAEIADIQFFDTIDYLRQTHLVPGVLQILKKLNEDGIID